MEEQIPGGSAVQFDTLEVEWMRDCEHAEPIINSEAIKWANCRSLDPDSSFPLPTDEYNYYDMTARLIFAREKYPHAASMLSDEYISSIEELISNNKIVVVDGDAGAGKSLSIMFPIIKYFEQRRLSQLNEFGVERYLGLKNTVLDIEDCEKILFLTPNTVCAENTFREYKQMIDPWYVRLNINGHSDNANEQYGPGSQFYVMVMTYQGCATIINRGQFGFIVLDEADCPDALHFDAALRCSLRALAEERCGKLVILMRKFDAKRSKIPRIVNFHIPNVSVPSFSVTRAVCNGDRQVTVESWKLPPPPQQTVNGQRERSSTPIAIHSPHFLDAVPSGLGRAMQLIFSFPKKDPSDWNEMEKSLKLPLQQFKSLEFNTALTISVAREAMKHIIREYGIADIGRQPLYREGNDNANCIPDVCVICRSVDQVNRVAIGLSGDDELVYTPPQYREENRSRFDYVNEQRSVGLYRITKLTMPCLADSFQLSSCRKALTKDIVGHYMHSVETADGMRAVGLKCNNRDSNYFEKFIPWMCGRLIIGTRQSLHGLDKNNLMLVVDCCEVFTSGVHSSTALISSPIRRIFASEAARAQSMLGRRGHAGWYVTVHDFGNVDFNTLSYPTVQLTLSAFIGIIFHEEAARKRIPPELLSSSECVCDGLRREAIACGYAREQVGEHGPFLSLTAVGRCIYPIFTFLQPDMSCFLLMCSQLGLVYPGVVVAALDMCKFRLFHSISTCEEDGNRRIGTPNLIDFFALIHSLKTGDPKHESDICAVTDAALSFLHFTNFEGRCRSSNGDFVRYIRQKIQPACAQNRTFSNFWSAWWLVSEKNEVATSPPSVHTTIDNYVRNNYVQGGTPPIEKIVRRFVSEDGRAEFERCFEVLVNELVAAKVLQKFDDFCDVSRNRYMENGNDNSWMTLRGRHLFSALLTMCSSRFASPVKARPATGKQSDEQPATEEQSTAQAYARECDSEGLYAVEDRDRTPNMHLQLASITRLRTKKAEWVRYCGSNAYFKKMRKEDNFFVTLLDPISSGQMSIFSNILGGCTVVDALFEEEDKKIKKISKIRLNYAASSEGHSYLFDVPSVSATWPVNATEVAGIRSRLQQFSINLICGRAHPDAHLSAFAESIIDMWIKTLAAK